MTAAARNSMNLAQLTAKILVESSYGEFGAPRSFVTALNGQQVLFLRSATGTRATHALHAATRGEDGRWRERTIIDPEELDTGSDGAPNEMAAAMLERLREAGTGIVGFSADAQCQLVAVAVAGAVWSCDVEAGLVAPVPDSEDGSAALLSPTGAHLAYIKDGEVVVMRWGEEQWEEAHVLTPRSDEEVLGYPDFIAAEELGREKGMWWAPDGRSLLIQVTDNEPLAKWTIPDPAFPEQPPRAAPYPVAVGPNARLSLRLLDLDSGGLEQLDWDERFPYLRDVVWSERGGLTIDVQSRDQKTLATLSHSRGGWEQVAEIFDPDWVEVGNGTCAHTPAGELCQVLDVEGERRLRIGADFATIPDRVALVSCSGAMAQGCIVQTAPSRDVRRTGLVSWDGSFHWLGGEGGVSRAWSNGSPVAVVQEASLEAERTETSIIEPQQSPPAASPPLERAPLGSNALALEWQEGAEFSLLGDGGTASALLWPSWFEPEEHSPLPLLVDSYGGPLVARVLRDKAWLISSRWLAEQGFAVLVVDGVGTPGRGHAWEKQIRGDLSATLDSQLTALDAAAAKHGERLNLEKVGIRGWSFGGYLAALAAIKRPDRFAAAVVGAPVYDWALYDTHYSERYLGQGEEFERNAKRASLASAIEAAVAAGRKAAPLLIVHGFSDDNVFVAHAVRLSEHLVSEGIAHSSLLLSSVTHVSRGEIVANLMELEVDFLRQQLG